jgi:hypothetical protein
MHWGGKLPKYPETSRMGSGEDRGSAFKSQHKLKRKKKRERRRVLRTRKTPEDSSPLPFLPASGRTIPMTTFGAASMVSVDAVKQPGGSLPGEKISVRFQC